MAKFTVHFELEVDEYCITSPEEAATNVFERLQESNNDWIWTVEDEFGNEYEVDFQYSPTETNKL